MSRPAKAVVNLNALRHNYQLAQRQGDAQAIAVIKANAYGHGAVAVARALEDLAPAFAVAAIEEALELREAGIRLPILLLEGPFSTDELAIAAEQNFWLMLADASQVEMVQQVSLESLPAPLTIWLKFDSGMHRLGLDGETGRSAYQTLRALDHVNDDIVLASHFACADELDDGFTNQQLTNFREMTAGLDAPVSLSNSAAILGWPEAHGQWLRAGIMLYGASPFMHSHPQGDQLQAVMSLESAVIGIRRIVAGASVGYGKSWVAQRDSVIATVAMGYGDGYPRHAPSGTPVLVNGQRASLVGRVSMDMITVDVTDLDTVNAGDPVVLWGQELPLNEVAMAAGTISYELVTRMPLRTPRIYIN
jgi:alanine racemase